MSNLYSIYSKYPGDSRYTRSSHYAYRLRLARDIFWPRLAELLNQGREARLMRIQLEKRPVNPTKGLDKLAGF